VGGRHTSEVAAFDPDGMNEPATHERMVIDMVRFVERLNQNSA